MILSLERAFDNAGYDIIGILESRVQADVVAAGEIFDMYSSVADTHGCCGSQLWDRRTSKARVTSITPHSPRLLTGAISIGSFVLGAIVAHSPHELAPDSDKNVFHKDSGICLAAFAT